MFFEIAVEFSMKMCTANVKILIPGIPVTVIGAQLF
jgi:hypothetical protein